MVKKISIAFVFLILAIGFISADFDFGKANHSIENYYSKGDNMSGWINISLDEEPANSELTTTKGDEITLQKLLEKSSNSEFKYLCNPTGCVPNYESTLVGSLNTFSLSAGNSKLFGLKITSNSLVTDITNFQFNLTSNNPESETIPLFIDILNRETNEWEAYNASNSYGAEEWGCFETAENNASITTTLYCNRVSIDEAAGVEIGADVNGAGSVKFRLEITKVDNSDSAYCETTASGTGRISCTPDDFSVKESGDYFVCIKTTKTVDNEKYKIESETDNACGFSGTYNNPFDFEIFARPRKYSSNINIRLDNEELKKANSLVSNLESYIENYIFTTYANNCTNGCIIPVKITAGVDQEITISDANLGYTAGITTSTSTLFDLEESPTLISTSGFQKLYFDEADFKVSSTDNNYKITFYFDDKRIFREEISVGTGATISYITPQYTAINYPTSFTAKVSGANITSYYWDFGDGIKQTTTTNQAKHTYTESGGYDLTLTVNDSRGRSSKETFEMLVQPASEVVPELIETYLDSLENIEKNLSSFTLFERTSIKNSLNTETIKKTLEALKKSEENANSESEFEIILNELINIKVPLLIAKTFSSDVSFYSERENINLDILKEISGGDYIKEYEDSYEEEILTWSSGAGAKMKFSEITGAYSGYTEPITRVFQISITNNEPVYFIIGDLENLNFSEQNSVQEKNGYKYIELEPGTNTIYFYTTEDVDFKTVPAFISPALSEITIPEWEDYQKEINVKKWIIFSAIVLGVVLIGFAIYILLQMWYKKKYEEYLFKNRNNLYNLVNYIKTSKARGLNRKEIESALKKTGWNSEQITYAMRKFEGKNTGMPEIPIRKLLREKEKEKKI